ncbi:hypothetical protein [Vreelandella salicampi]|uniref:MFS transporter n=1 Tax=Vreelandella salicampi TaxID=1449798 RepID=A0A7Z0LP58_9GAMM|nr:hypothetical protein [Halomonas salicampi]NYS62562.1 hypothetical protein [Halomonas salicampi]
MPSPDLQLSPVESGEDGYHALVSLLLVPLGCAAVVAGWVLYAMLALASPGGDYPEALPSMTFALPVVIGVMMAWTVHWLSKRLRSWVTIQILLALQGGGLIWLGAAEQAWEFVLVAVGLGVSGGVISAGVVHVRSWAPQCRGGVLVGLHGAILVGGGLSWLLVPMVTQAYGWRIAAWSLILPVVIVMLLLWLFVEPTKNDAANC